MAAERSKRIDLYVGPRGRVPREDLPRYEGGWVAELKYDGEWCLATIEKGMIVSADSRVGKPLLRGPRGLRVALSGSGQLAGELVVGDSGVMLYLFEPCNWNGHDLRDLPLEERREALEMIYSTFTKCGAVQLSERRESGFLAWYDEIMSVRSKVRGDRPEGLVLKRRGSPGRASCADGKVDFQVKCKPLNTVDYVVIGSDGVAEKGTPKVALGLFKDGKIVKCMSPTCPAGMDLSPGDVVEVEGAEVFPSGAIRHGHITRRRTDKRVEDCTFAAAMEA